MSFDFDDARQSRLVHHHVVEHAILCDQLRATPQFDREHNPGLKLVIAFENRRQRGKELLDAKLG